MLRPAGDQAGSISTAWSFVIRLTLEPFGCTEKMSKIGWARSFGPANGYSPEAVRNQPSVGRPCWLELLEARSFGCDRTQPRAVGGDGVDVVGAVSVAHEGDLGTVGGPGGVAVALL